MTHNDPTDITGDTKMTDSPTSVPAAGPPSQRGIGWLTAGILAAILVVIAGGAFAVRGLRGDGSTPTESPTRAVTATVTSSPPPTPSATADPEMSEAEQAVRTFWEMSDLLHSDSELPISEFARVARDKTLKDQSLALQVFRVKGLRQVGKSRLLTVDVSSGKPVESRESMSVEVCYDVSAVDVVDAKGKSVVKPGRPSQALATYRVERFTDGWRVTRDESKGAKC